MLVGLLVLAATPIAALATAVWLMTLPEVQTRAAERAADWLTSRTGGEIHFEQVGVILPDGLLTHPELRFDGLRIVDREGETLLGSAGLTVRVSLPELLRRTVHIERIMLEEARGHVYRSKQTGAVNLMMFVDPFRRPPAGRPPPVERQWSVVIDEIELQRSQLKLEPQPAGRAWDVTELEATARNLRVAGGEVRWEIRDLAFSERGGLRLQQGSTVAAVSPSMLSLAELRLHTPASVLSGRFEAEFPDWTAFADAPGAVALTGELTELELGVTDLAAVFPDVPFDRYLGTPGSPELRYPRLAARGRLDGTLKEPALSNLVLGFGDHSSLRASAGVFEPMRGVEGSLELEIDELLLDRRDLRYLVEPAEEREAAIPEELALSGRVRAGDRSIEAALSARAPYGELDLDGGIEWPGLEEGFRYRVALESGRIELARVLPEQALLGAAAVQLEAYGHGRTASDLVANFEGRVPQIEVGATRLHDLELTGRFERGRVTLAARLDDPHLVLDGKAAFEVGGAVPRYRGHVEVRHADLEHLGILPHELQLSGLFEFDAAGDSLETLAGSFESADLTLRYDGRRVTVSSAELRARSRPGYTQLTLVSEVADAVFLSNLPIGAVPRAVRGHLRRFFPTPETAPEARAEDHLLVIAEFRDLHPLLAGFIPDLEALSPGSLRVELGRDKQVLEGVMRFDRIAYRAVDLTGFEARVLSDGEELAYELQAERAAIAAGELHGPRIHGTTRDGTLEAFVAFQDAEDRVLLRLGVLLEQRDAALVARILPDEMTVAGERWVVPEDHEIRFEPNRISVDNVRFGTGVQWISARTRTAIDGSERLEIELSNIALSPIGEAVGIAQDRFSGTLDATIELMLRTGEPLVLAEIALSQLRLEGIDLGRVTARGGNRVPGRIDAEFEIEHEENRARGTGYAIPADRIGQVELDIARLDLRYLRAAALGEVTETEGHISGSFRAAADLSRPAPVRGEGWIEFHGARVGVRALNTEFQADGQRVELSESGVLLEEFILRDAEGNPAMVSGKVEPAPGEPAPQVDLALQTDRFTVLDTTSLHHDSLYGRVVIGSDLRISGTLAEAVVEGTVDLQAGTTITYVMPSFMRAKASFASLMQMNGLPYREGSNTSESCRRARFLRVFPRVLSSPSTSSSILKRWYRSSSIVDPETGSSCAEAGSSISRSRRAGSRP